MKIITLKKFVEQSHIEEKLIRAVVKQSGGWETFEEVASDIVNCGVDGGFGGWIYYTETVAFAQENLKGIKSLAKDLADSIGEPGAYSLIAGFNCLNGYGLSADDIADIVHDEDHEDYTTVMNSLAWFAAEEVARSYDDLCI